MNPITSLPIIQEHNLFDSQERNQQCKNHNHPLHHHIAQLHETLSHKRQQQTHHSVQEPHSETLCTKLHSRTLIEKHELRRIIAIHQKHWHLPYDVVHGTRDTEEVYEDRTRQPDFGVVEQGLTREKLLHEKGYPDQDDERDEDHLVPGDNRGSMDGSHRDPGFGFDELGHGLGEPGEIALVHGLGILETLGGAHEANVGEGVDAELGEGELGFFEFDVAEEEFTVVRVVGDEGGGDEGEFVAEVEEAELGLVVELDGVEEEDEGVGAWGVDGGEEAREGLVVEVDHAGF